MPKSIPGVVGARTCNLCRAEKRAERFYLSNPYQCKKCLRDRTRAHRKEHPDIWTTYKRRHTLKKLYGITPEQYKDLLARQDGKCAICESAHVHRRGMNNFAIDHDHQSGIVRALLCHNCNRGLGHFKDSPELLVKAVLYLKSFGQVKSA